MIESGKDERMQCLANPSLSVQSALFRIYGRIIDSAPPVELPAYDEAKERELFTAFAMEGFLNIHRLDNGHYFYMETRIAWSAWKACAKSRARSAE